MGLCRVLVYVTAGYAAVSEPSPWIFGAALVSLSYLIGLTFIAKQEAYDHVGRLWPLIFLSAPFVYTLPQLGQAPMAGGSIAVGLAASVLVALALLRRRARGDVGRAVVGLIAAISLVDALFLALAGAPGAASVAVLCYLATLVMQRWVSGT
jgi:4-hydroxybenzoate polyprenyltransferase